MGQRLNSPGAPAWQGTGGEREKERLTIPPGEYERLALLRHPFPAPSEENGFIGLPVSRQVPLLRRRRSHALAIFLRVRMRRTAAMLRPVCAATSSSGIVPSSASCSAVHRGP